MGDPAQEALLRVQEHDITLSQLRHRRDTLPERAELAAEQAALGQLDAELETVRARRADLERSQQRLEDEVDAVQSKATEVDRTLYSGTVANPRELQAMQDEIASLKRRQSALEDQLLEVLELSEPVDDELRALDARRADLDGRLAGLRSTIASAESDLDVEIAGVETARGEAAGAVAEDLLRSYEQLRDRLGGIGVARLEGNRCTGCHLTLPATEVDQIKRLPPEAIVRHEECGRILVR